MCFAVFFFFSSRRRHTRLTCDWSSDVCSSDLDSVRRLEILSAGLDKLAAGIDAADAVDNEFVDALIDWLGPCEEAPSDLLRSEERRVGKECSSGWWRGHGKKKRTVDVDLRCMY